MKSQNRLPTGATCSLIASVCLLAAVVFMGFSPASAATSLTPQETVAYASSQSNGTANANRQDVDATATPTAIGTPAFSGGLSLSEPVANSSAVHLYDKFELTFEVSHSVATNPQFPFDPSTPAGLQAGVGITVEGLFLPPGETDWQKAIVQPAFLYQGYQHELVGGTDWLYLQGKPDWKVRLAPTIQGVWHYQLRAQDASTYPNWLGTGTDSFDVGAPAATNHGFVEVSKSDPRYFAFSDGSRFVGAGRNVNFDEPRFLLDADAQLDKYSANGADLFRTWMTRGNLVGSAWNQWAWFNGPSYGGYLPDPGLEVAPAGSGRDFTFKLDQVRQCIFNGWLQGPVAVKPGTSYRLSVTAKVSNVAGPKSAGAPYGFTVKYGSWPANDSCPGGTASFPSIIPHTGNTDWTTLDGVVTTGPSDYFLRNLYLELDNATSGEVNISEVSLREELADGTLGSEILVKSNPDMYTEFNQLRSWDWDYVLDRAAERGVRFKLVILEKNDRVWNRLNPDGSFAADDIGRPENLNFYNWEHTKVRRLQEYYWRYLAARWSYSTAIHSWELLNEGDPYQGAHWDLANSFAEFMAQWDRNHLVTTSFWHSYPAKEFWNNADFPFPGYADIHAYSDNGPIPLDLRDEAAFHLSLSQWVHSQGVPHPTVRGEAGFNGSGGEDPSLARDTRGVWLHNFTWAELDPGGLYELYWYTDNIVKNDLYFQFRPFAEFMQGIPLDNGRYADAQASASDGGVRVVGQKDVAKGRSHLWIQNRIHTSWNVVNRVAWGRLSGTVTVAGFGPGQSYSVDWWQFDDPGNLTRRGETAQADPSGIIVLDLSALPDTITDSAVRIGDYAAP